jgi:drug/metabolite transporter (DMT)-like permease
MTKRVHIAGILFATIFGFSFMFSKVVLDSSFVSPIGLIAYRFLVAFLAFEILRRLKVIQIRFDRSTFKYFFWVAFFQPILYFLFETFGLAKTTSGEAGMMIALIPIFVTILSSFILKERPNIVQIGFIILSVTGVVFIQVMKSSEGLSYSFVGFLLLLGAVLSAAMFNIASRKASLVLTPVEVTYFMMMLGALAFNIIYVTQLTVQGNIVGYFTNVMHFEVILPILYLGLIASIFGFALVNYALSKAPAHITSIYANLSTLVAVAAGAMILGEKLEYYHLIGSLMIVSGVYGTVRFRKDQLILIKKRKELKQ